jgi:hypothetical protein
MVAAAESAPSCEGVLLALGVWWYSHALIADGHKKLANWSGTDEPQNRRQRELVGAYNCLWWMSWCRSKLLFL